MKKIQLLTVFTILLLSVAGCLEEQKPPEELIPEEVYTDLLMEIIMTGYYIQIKDIEDQRDSLFAVLFDEYGVTQVEYDSSHAWYLRDVKVHTKRIESIREELSEESDRLENAVQTPEP